MNELAITIGLISLPGLIATILADKLVVHTTRWEVFKYSIYTFVLGLSAYGALQVLSFLANVFDRHLPFLAPGKPLLATWAAITTSGAKPVPAEIAWASVVAPLVAVVAIHIANRKLLNRFAQKVRVSEKYGDENLFSYYLNLNVVNWVYVRDISNNLSYCGRVHSFSETPELQELVLSDVIVYSYAESEELYQVPMVYLSHPPGSFLIEAAPDPDLGGSDNEERDQGREGPDPSEGRAHPNNGPVHHGPPPTPATA